MPGFLFHDVIFGPVRSRRLGLSLGINLLPLHSKYCSFNCIYCECGWTPARTANAVEFPDRRDVARYLEQRLKELAAEDYLPDALTYAGNGEPTLHPSFPEIVDDTLALRDRLAPESRVSILSNSSMIHDDGVFGALLKLDNNILKLDAGNERLFNLINNPGLPVSYPDLVRNLRRFDGKVIIQSMFLRGVFRGEVIDNTTPGEVDAWITRLLEIRPGMVMIYPIARPAPLHSLEKITPEELESIAEKVRKTGLSVQVYH
jgi:wyosine [tRNA(Phe)-imidazoG37] synthetase (radical SAM superfamily)